ncbi:MAG: EpsD family peptidyl-prolyl cis-trans isomerase [Burkholderiales bacterium]|nr:EpsD family peptidyl-prolyl cis-trans isomerase [Burkholderiales bacterium]
MLNAAGLARWLAAGALAALVLAGCGEKKEVPSPIAARVDKHEISNELVNFVLQQQRGLRPEQVDAASRQILDRLIDQQLAIDKAEDLGLESEPGVAVALEAARRDILSRAYLEKVGADAAKATPEDVKKYYDSKPALFARRRIYNIQEIMIEATPEQIPGLREKLSAATKIDEFLGELKTGGFKFAGNQLVRPAEQLPPNSLETVSKMSDGQALMLPAPGGVQVVVLAGSQPQPVTLEQARPAIEQAILSERRARLAEDKIKSLRAGAKIEYIGHFAQAPASAPAASAASVPG